MNFSRSKLQALRRITAAGGVLLWLSLSCCWSAGHLLEPAPNSRSHVPLGQCTTANFHHDQAQNEASCSILDATRESDERVVEAESLSEPLKFYCNFLKANAATLRTVDVASAQTRAQNDWVFLPEACASRANRSLAPPVPQSGI